MSDPNILSLIPVFVTLLVALTARNVLVGLFTGVLVGVAMIADTSLLLFVPTLVRNYLVPEVADTYNASVLVLLVFIGGFVKLIEYSGGGTAFARVATRWVTGKARAQLASWVGGIMIFFSDLGTPLIVGPVFQPLMDRLRISRQKLAFILDSTSSPVAILIPVYRLGRLYHERHCRRILRQWRDAIGMGRIRQCNSVPVLCMARHLHGAGADLPEVRLRTDGKC